MQNREDVEAALGRVDTYAASKYPGMSYEQGVAEALEWVLGDIPNEEFTYGQDE